MQQTMGSDTEVAPLARTQRALTGLTELNRRVAALAPRTVIAPLVAVQWVLLLAVALQFGHGSIAVAVVQALVLMPLALVLTYQVGNEVAGRSFAAWAAALWVVLPYAGIAYTTPSLRHLYEHRFLPHLLGLHGDARFLAMIAFLASLAFALRAARSAALFDVVVALAAAAAGAALVPRSALVSVAAVVPLVLGGRRRSSLAGLVALAALLGGVGAAVAADLLGGPFARIDFGAAGDTLASLRENFWSGRVLEWLAIAGIAGAIRGRVPAGAALAVAFLAAFFSVEHAAAVPLDRNLGLLLVLQPVWPAVTLLLASIVLLVPRGGRTPRHAG